MCGGIKRIFFVMWPSQPRKVYTKPGKLLRKWFKGVMIAHLILFFLCFAFVGFANAMTNFASFMLIYSCKLTLRNCTIWFYYVF